VLAVSCANSPSSPPAAPDVDANGNTAATSITREANADAARGLPLNDTRQAGLREMILSDDFQVDGSRMDLLSFFSLLGAPNGTFAIVTP
jgi:alkyl sulfatase BDS1-like metallo-beta-lactamase superfamily hydrolase